MNSNKSVFWGFVSLTVACCSAWYIERSKFMIEKKKKIEEATESAKQRQQQSQQSQPQQNNNIESKNGDNNINTYKPYDETNTKRNQ